MAVLQSEWDACLEELQHDRRVAAAAAAAAAASGAAGCTSSGAALTVALISSPNLSCVQCFR
jgi:hypothetical protein